MRTNPQRLWKVFAEISAEHASLAFNHEDSEWAYVLLKES